ncbi:MAG TPA: aminotransferase class I/II-fold pyridoxal phosphate-dependent enzyme, partial [Gammaproteobacteria bacterium]|nr:aminotransferase class I/II-fold pyridoxal phosphate-dependent enzyme [Gammaproteobacteria bacterium]
LARIISRVRPELDLYMTTDQSAEELAGSVVDHCRRVFYHKEDFLELHLNILSGIASRYQTPFFSALRQYAKQPTGVFHALPISRGKSITKSNWIRDMIDFYGMNIFLAETSATSGGLDSLLEPHGPIKKAHELASRAYGSRRTFFATNGTSTCNKIVVQALVRPGDIVLVDRDCHKSHHYGMVLSGAQVVYLDSYPLNEYSMYGAVPLHEIKRQLLTLKKAGKLARVKMLLLTNCTFDGIVYDVQRVMEECLAIKPDLVFLWDEAWFGFAGFGPTYRQRTAMYSAAALRERYASRAYAREYAVYQNTVTTIAEDDSAWLDLRLMPDPAQVRVRVYATQSTHKTLTALRQGSMIHIHDQDYKSQVEESFHEAFMTHTSTSPNYQILASLDIGRRQVELEGFELVQKQVEMAMSLRSQVSSHPLLSKYFRILRVADMIPASYRQSGIEGYFEPGRGWNDIWEAWEQDEFCLDATRLTLFVGATGLEGDAFKNEVLMNKYGIQINKTSRNTVLFMTNIGTTRSSVAYLIEALVKFAHELERNIDEMSPPEWHLHRAKVKSITQDLPPLPDFSRFHDGFRSGIAEGTGEGLLREAFFLAYDETCCEYLDLYDGSLDAEMAAGREVVSANFVIPYPPGFPILVPGQVASPGIIEYLRKLDVKEIHGFREEFGLRVFTEQALAKQMHHNNVTHHQDKKA